jgi:hypothetical protein
MSRNIIIFILMTSCSSGLIPCPEPSSSLVSKGNRNPKVTELQDMPEKKGRKRLPKEKVTHHISLEEWDCPRSEKRKYLPRAIKKNIKHNLEKIKEVQGDSTHLPENVQ